MRFRLLLTFATSVLLTFSAAAGVQAKSGKKQQNQQQAKGSSHLHVDSGELLSASGLPIHVSHFDAIVGGDQKAQPNDGGKKPVVTIHNGVAFLTRNALTKLLNSHLANGNIKDLSVETADNKVTIKGKAHKVVDVPFKIEGPVTATSDGMIRLQVSNEHAAHLPQALTNALGFDDLRKMIGSNASHGVKADKNSVTFDPDLMWGLPIHGRVTRAATSDKGLSLTFGPDTKVGASAGR